LKPQGCPLRLDHGRNTETSTEMTMSEAENNPHAREEGDPRRKNLRPPWAKGVSGNPRGRVPIERRVRRYARRYDVRMCKVLASIAEDAKVPPAERRRAAMDLIAVGSGRPAVIQELAGRGGEALGPLVALNFQTPPIGGLTPTDVYKLMAAGLIPADPHHPAFVRRPSIDAEASTAADTATPTATAANATTQTVESAGPNAENAPVCQSGAGADA